jgi:DNA-binding protein H-NS
MTTRIKSKIQKLSEKKAELEKAIAELEAQEKASQVSADHPDIKAILNLIAETSAKLKIQPKKMMSILASSTRTIKADKAPVMIKYRDTAPGNESNTWSGRGAKPLWLKRYEANGRSIEDFRVLI